MVMVRAVAILRVPCFFVFIGVVVEWVIATGDESLDG